MSKVFPDAKILSENERRKLCEMLHRALLEIRILGWQGKSEQAADLADAFHNLPVYLYSEDFSSSFFQNFLESYQQKYPRSGTNFDYLKLLKELDEEVY